MSEASRAWEEAGERTLCMRRFSGAAAWTKARLVTSNFCTSAVEAAAVHHLRGKKVTSVIGGLARELDNVARKRYCQ